MVRPCGSASVGVRSIEPDTIGTSSLLIVPLIRRLELHALRARLLAQRLPVVVGRVGVEVERVGVVPQDVEASVELADELTARACEALGHRDLRELGPIHKPQPTATSSTCRRSSCQRASG